MISTNPVTDKRAMRLLVDEVVAEYDARTLTSAPPPLADAAGASRVVYDAVAGFGPLPRNPRRPGD